MTPDDGRGSSRIVLVGPRAERPPPVPVARAAAPPPRARRGESGWTPRRLTVGLVLGGAMALAGGLLFVARFGVLGGEDSPLLATGFGLFAVGMLVFCGCLVGLVGHGVAALVERLGWGPAAAALAAPAAVPWALWAVGAAPYAVPAALSLLVIGGVVAALR